MRIPVLVLSGALCATLLPAAPQDRAELRAAFDKLCAEHVAQTVTPGLAAALILDGKVVLAKGYGLRDVQDKLPVEADTRFAIASVSKQFICAAVLLLQEDGKLSVHDKVMRWYPRLARAGEISLLDLMNHTSGYPDYYPLDFVDRRMSRPIEPEELLEQYAGEGVALDFAPGTAYSYSNTGYILLGEVIRKVSGMSVRDFLRARIFEPLGMKQTRYDPDPRKIDMAKGYMRFSFADSEPNTPEAKGWVGAAGGIYTTVGDLARWDLALLRGELLSPRSFALMTQRRRLKNMSLSNYGCGLSIGTLQGKEMLSHGGAVSGFNSWNAIFPGLQAGVVLFSNHDGGLGALRGKVQALLGKLKVAVRPTSVPVVAGPGVEVVVAEVFAALQKGEVERRRFTPDFGDYLTVRRVRAAAAKLAAYGAPARLDVRTRRERGGMEVTLTDLHFEGRRLQVLMYRHPDGKIAEFFVR